MVNKFKEIEQKYNVEEIRYKNDKIWAFLRLKYYWKTLEPLTSSYNESKKEIFFNKIIKIFQQSFYGFKNWFHRYDYIIFSDTQERMLIDNQYIDKSFEYIIQELGYDKCLYIDLPNPKHLPIEKIATKHIVSHFFIKIFIKIYSVVSYLFYKKDMIKLEIFENINNDNNLDINYQKDIIEFNQSVFIYKIFFKIYRPKVVFVSCYYCNQSMIKAANSLKILTIEAQHGLMGRSHGAYTINKVMDKIYFPNILLTFGEYDKNILKTNIFNPYDKIIPIGRYNLELLNKIDIPIELLIIKSKYKNLISISTQYPVENELALFVKELAFKYPDMAFIFSLRHYDKEYYNKYDMPFNIYLFKGEFNCYDILKCSDIHMTCYSSCAFEALFFEKSVCLVNIKGFAQEYITVKSKNIYTISTIDEFENIDFEYKEEQMGVYSKNHTILVQNFLKELKC